MKKPKLIPKKLLPKVEGYRFTPKGQIYAVKPKQLKPSEEIAELLEFNWPIPCHASNCKCESNEMWIEGILQYLDKQASELVEFGKKNRKYQSLKLKK